MVFFNIKTLFGLLDYHLRGKWHRMDGACHGWCGELSWARVFCSKEKRVRIYTHALYTHSHRLIQRGGVLLLAGCYGDISLSLSFILHARSHIALSAGVCRIVFHTGAFIIVGQEAKSLYIRLSGSWTFSHIIETAGGTRASALSEINGAFHSVGPRKEFPSALNALSTG
jgi:hypothetical protein